MTQRITVVDAFTDQPFSGNPAAVCLLSGPADEAWMRAVAGEMNLSETAFLHVIEGQGAFSLRWFTPAIEVDLCGHATLAAAHVLWTDQHLGLDREIRFLTRSGWLSAMRRGDEIDLDFPELPTTAMPGPGGLETALGAKIRNAASTGMDLLVEVESEAVVRSLSPDMGFLATLPVRGVIVTSLATTPGYDFVSRFFAPQCGIPEDPVTGSAHCALAPYWGGRLGKAEMVGHQASPRGGVVRVLRRDGRVTLGGRAVTVLRGELLAGPG